MILRIPYCSLLRSNQGNRTAGYFICHQFVGSSTFLGQVNRAIKTDSRTFGRMGSPKKGVIDLTDDQPAQDVVTLSDSDDEDLKTAIALSLQSMPRTHSPEPAKEKAVAYGILGVDRRQQEQERLARLKRKRDGIISPPLLHRKSPVPSSSTSTRAIASINSSAGPSDRLEKEDTESTPKSTLQYENGVLKKTWAFGYARDQDIKIEEILQRSTLQAAVFSSFQWDMEWFFRKLDTSRTKFVLVMQAKGEAIKHQYRQETASMPNLRLCFPPMDGQVNCMHSKLMLLFHPTYLRVVVPTANLVPYDWGEGGGVMENMVFLIDLPLRAVSTPTRPTTPFKEEMLSFLQAQEMHQDVLDKLELFDFTRTQHYRFIHTMGGSHYEPILRTTGLCGLGKAVKSLSLETTDEIQIDYITSSVGSLNTEFLKLIYQAAQGEDGVSHITKRISGHSTVEGSKKDHQIDWERCFRCYFPSEDTVRSSKAGPAGAGTVCFQEDWWKKPTFPRMIMRDCISTREGMLMHNKIMYVRSTSANVSSTGPGWAYVGSANLSESAWGKVVLDRVTKGPKLNCRNWECGVLIPFKSLLDRSVKNEDISKDLRTVNKKVPVPIQLPARDLSNTRPWFFMSR